MENIRRETCRLCGSTELLEVISLGNQYINDFPPHPSKKGRNGECPLDIIVCKKCSLYQLRHSAPQELLYSRHYWYRSGINSTIVEDLKEIATISCKLANLKSDDVFLDIGANDGMLLKNLKGSVITVGCEPAINLHQELKQNCDYVIPDFWSYEQYQKLDLKKAKVITAIGMFYDMEDPNQFIRDVCAALDENGLFVAQLMTLKPMLEKNDLGNICHEHLEYYTYKSLLYLFENNGLEIFKIEENTINGGSYRIFARHLKNGSINWQEQISIDSLISFKERLDLNKELCVNFIRKVVAEGKKVYVYGASTKGNAILQYYNLGCDLIVGAADKNPEKWGAYTLTDIPIVSEEEGRKHADYFLILPVGFVNEFVEREKDWLNKGGQFIVPLPDFKIIGKKL